MTARSLRALRLAWVGGSAAIVLASGCDGRCDDPRIVGGTVEERAIAAEVYSDFRDAIGEQPLCVPTMRFTDIPGVPIGGYDRGTRAIRVEDEINVRKVVTHELCHAVQHQADIPLEPAELWVFSPSYELPEIYRVPGEAFAYTCDVGPTTVHLVGEACDADTPGAEAYQALLDVFPVPPADVVAAPTWVEVGAEPFTAPVATLEVSLLEGGGLALRVEHDEGYVLLDTHWVDLWTGGPALPVAELPMTYEPVPGPQGTVRLQWASVEGRAVLEFGAVATNGGVARRLVYRDGDLFAPLGCPRPLEQLFAADGLLWAAYADGDAVVWGYWDDAAGGT